MKHEIELQPFTVPNFVRPVPKIGKREEGFIETPVIPLSDLSNDTLERLCEEFKKSVFEKARKQLSDE